MSRTDFEALRRSIIAACAENIGMVDEVNDCLQDIVRAFNKLVGWGDIPTEPITNEALTGAFEDGDDMVGDWLYD